MINKILMGILIFLMVIFLSACKKSESIENRFPSGNIEYIKNDSVEIYYYDTINSKIFEKVFHEKEYDSIVFYYKNGNIFKTGKNNKKGLKYGNWNIYTLEGYLSKTIEYFIIKNEAYSNRFWFFNKNGDTLWYASKFNRYDQKEFEKDTLGTKNSTMISFNIYSKDTIMLNEPFLASVICNSPLGREYNSQIVMFLAKEENNFNKYFSNEKEVKLDTFFNLVTDKKNRVNFDVKHGLESYRYIAAFGRWFDTPGEKILRGYMLEHFNILESKDKFQRHERRVYFEKKIYVKDTVK